MATKVSLRQKKISKGRKSLYLDFYPPISHSETGKTTRREFLNLYIFLNKKEQKAIIDELKETINDRKKSCKDCKLHEKELEERLLYYKGFKSLTPIDKKHNAETLKIAESIRQQKENVLNKPEIYSQYEKEQLKIKQLGEKCFIDFFRQLANKRKSSTHDNWLAALNYLEAFFGETLKFVDLNETGLEDFKEYLLTTKSKRSDKTTLSTNSAVSYFNKVKAALKQAYKDRLLTTDLNSKVEPIKAADTRREYLTLEELNALVKTPCNDQLLKRAALFSALTGMAFKEIQNLVWKDISYIKDEGYLILTKRQKTKRDNYLPIPEQAYNLLGERKEPIDKVFDGLTYSAYQNKHLFQWIGAAGITKNITFHCFRHTYATLQLSNGTDIYTVSKMLGHKDLKTTQIYAKIVDEAKRKATNKIKLDL